MYCVYEHSSIEMSFPPSVDSDLPPTLYSLKVEDPLQINTNIRRKETLSCGNPPV